MYGNMQSKTKQIYVLVHIMALNEFQNSFGYDNKQIIITL